jgi:hypothetical protein
MTEKPVAPALHTDKLWDVDKLEDGCLTNLDVTPIPARDMTKRAYFAELHKRGLRMKNQQESSTGPEVDLDAVAAQEAAALAALQTIVPPRPFSAHTARILQAHEAVLARYGLIETLGCDICWQAGRSSGCRTRVDATGVRVECRCGVRAYRAPTGTTDQTQTGPAASSLEQTSGMLFDSLGQPTARPTVLITRADADIIRAYQQVRHRHHLSRSLFCRLCWGGRLSQTSAILESVTPDQVVYVCACRIRFAQT